MNIAHANMIAIRAFSLASRQMLKKFADVLENTGKLTAARVIRQYAEAVAVIAFDIEQEYQQETEEAA